MRIETARGHASPSDRQKKGASQMSSNRALSVLIGLSYDPFLHLTLLCRAPTHPSFATEAGGPWAANSRLGCPPMLHLALVQVQCVLVPMRKGSA